MKQDRRYLFIIAALFLFNSCAVWYGFDRMPLLTNSDECFFSDPAISLLRGYGYICKSVLNFDKVFGHHPPLYFLLQAFIFNCFGISAFTLRSAGIIFYILSLLGVALIFFRLFQIGIFGKLAFFLTTTLFFSDLTFFSYARWGRPDSLALFLGISAFLLLLSKTQITSAKKRWVAAAIIMGLSLSTHFEMVIFWAIFVAASVFRFGRKNHPSPLKVWGFILPLAFIPLFVVTVIWVLTNGARSYSAMLQFRQILQIYLVKHYAIIDFFQKGLSDLPADFMRGGGQALILVIFSWVVLLARLYSELRSQRPFSFLRNKWLVIMAVLNLVVFMVLTLFTEWGTQRMLVVLPIALVGLGVALSGLDLKSFVQKLVIYSIIFLALLGLAAKVFYILKVHAEWSQRDPDRFHELVSNIPLKSRALIAYPLWFEFMRQGRPVRFISYLEDLEHYKNSPRELEAFDIIILRTHQVPLLVEALSNWKARVVKIGTEEFIIFEKSLR